MVANIMIDDKTDAERIIEAAICAIWHLERWYDVADRLFAIRCALIYVAPTHPAMEDLTLLSEIASLRARA